MTNDRSFELLARAGELSAGGPSVDLYRAIESALAEMVGFKLLTFLRLHGTELVRTHSSDPATYSAGGTKDIKDDRWLSSMLAAGVPVLSEGEAQVRERFFDHGAIAGMGCASVLNIPVRARRVTLGSFNLLHEAGWFKPEHMALAQPFAVPLALAWIV